jgi:hypothetical protein
VGTPAPSLREKRGNLHFNKNPARGNISSIPISEQTSGVSGEKKPQNPNPTTGAQGIKTVIKNNSKCINLNAE